MSAALLAQLEAPMRAAAGAKLADPAAARAALARAFPHDGPEGRALRATLLAAVQAGTICDRGKDAIRYSRLAKPEATPHALSVDFVWMTGPGISHRHPRGEVNLCYAVEGDPRFDGQPEGWVVFPPGSEHVPTVSGGRMLIVYFLPGGAVEWTAAPTSPASAGPKPEAR
ncbi:MAG: 4-hydroxylaminobenzoate lyase [Planctomycetota bacterium]